MCRRFIRDSPCQQPTTGNQYGEKSNEYYEVCGFETKIFTTRSRRCTDDSVGRDVVTPTENEGQREQYNYANPHEAQRGFRQSPGRKRQIEDLQRHPCANDVET
ncbi:MAG: hypothetical protein ACK2UO_02535, partial [Caldilineaceae bacterium]